MYVIATRKGRRIK